MSTTWVSGGVIVGVYTPVDPDVDPDVWRARHFAAVEAKLLQFPPD